MNKRKIEDQPEWAMRLEAKIDDLRLAHGLIDRAKEIIRFWIGKDGGIRGQDARPRA